MKDKRLLRMIILIVCCLLLMTSCMREDVDIKIKPDGSSLITVTAGIKKEVFDQYFADSEPTYTGNSGGYASTVEELTWKENDITYVGAKQTFELENIEQLENFLLHMNFETGDMDDTGGIFDVVEIRQEKNGMRETMTIHAVTASQDMSSKESLLELNIPIDLSSIMNFTLEITMPGRTTATGCKVSGKTAKFQLTDITETHELQIVSSNFTYSAVFLIVLTALVVVLGIYAIVKLIKRIHMKRIWG